jgi:hypothetical protein
MVDAESRGVFASIIPRTRLDVRILMDRYNFQRSVWSLLLEPHRKFQICNPMGFHLRARTVRISESCSLVSQSGFLRGTPLGTPLKATGFDVL